MENYVQHDEINDSEDYFQNQPSKQIDVGMLNEMRKLNEEIDRRDLNS